MASKRVQFEITDEGLKALLILKEQLSSATVADAIRSSLKIAKKIEEERKLGNKVFIIDKDNKQRELEFI